MSTTITEDLSVVVLVHEDALEEVLLGFNGCVELWRVVVEESEVSSIQLQ